MENLAGNNRTCNDSITNEKQNKAILLLQNVLKMESHTFTAAVRGYHFYRRYWRPQENEKLICLHEPGNAFDRFAIKTVKENGEIVGHLPKEISRITKYYLDRGASMYCRLSSQHYRRSPLVQGGLEIQCELVIDSRATMLQSKLTARYLDPG